ncbi:MAG: class I SAM-dependent methyltransferase [Chitinophagales bacterium]
MLNFISTKHTTEVVDQKEIYIFDNLGENIDMRTVESFGEEWTAFDHFSEEEITKAGDQYFDIVKDEWIEGKTVLDVGCGTGRWSRYVSNKAQFVEAIDPSKAVFSAAKLLQNNTNVRISKAGVDTIPFADNAFDFVFSLGVLHHIPDTKAAMKKCVEKLKPNGYFLVYLYYDFEQRGTIFKFIFWLSSLLRFIVSKLPSSIKKLVCNLIAVFIYLPFIYISKLTEAIGMKSLSNMIPLSYYKTHSINIVFNDALDRFGTPLEQRFSREEVSAMMTSAGLKEIVFSHNEPYWHAIGKKA